MIVIARVMGISLLVGLLMPVVTLQAQQRVVFSGGPAGGTFQIVANSIQVYEPIKDIKGYNIRAQSSAGSVENLRKVNSNKSQFGVIHSVHVYLGRRGELTGDSKKYTDVLAVSHLYGSVAQLIVNANSGITQIKDLVGKRIGVGNAGSGAFANAQLFFSYMGVWDKMERNALGYNDAANAFGNNQLDGFWLFTAIPSGAVMMAAQTNDIAAIDLVTEGEEAGFYKMAPYFTKTVIPAGAYKGIDKAVPSFQGASVWVANPSVPDDLVYEMLSIVFSDAGYKYMVEQSKTFKVMTAANGVEGIVTPLHPGAERFWKEKGLIK